MYRADLFISFAPEMTNVSQIIYVNASAILSEAMGLHHSHAGVAAGATVTFPCRDDG